MTKRSVRSILDDNLGGVYEMFAQKGVHLDEEDKENIRSFAAGAVADVIEEADEEEMTDEEAVQAFINGELDLEPLSDEDIVELFNQVPDELKAQTMINNDEDPSILEDEDEDEEEGDEEEIDGDIELVEDEDGNIIAVDENGDEVEIVDEEGNVIDPSELIEDDEDEGDEEYDEEEIDDDDEVEERSFAGYDGGGLTEAKVRRMIDEAYQAGLSAAEEAAEEAVENNNMAQQRAFALAEASGQAEDFVNNLIEQGKLPPHLADTAYAAINASLGVNGSVRSFAAGDLGEYGNSSLTDLITGLLDNMPQQSGFRAFSAPRPISEVRAFSSSEIGRVGSDHDLSYELNENIRAIQAEARSKGTDLTWQGAYKIYRDSIKQ